MKLYPRNPGDDRVRWLWASTTLAIEYLYNHKDDRARLKASAEYKFIHALYILDHIGLLTEETIDDLKSALDAVRDYPASIPTTEED